MVPGWQAYRLRQMTAPVIPSHIMEVSIDCEACFMRLLQSWNTMDLDFENDLVQAFCGTLCPKRPRSGGEQKLPSFGTAVLCPGRCKQGSCRASVLGNR